MSRTILRNNRTSVVLLFAVVLSVLLSGRNVHAQEIHAYTKAGATPFVYLSWSPDTSGTQIRYNIYRKLTTDASFGSTPLNAAPLAPITNCTTFKSFIPEASLDWNLLANAFADSLTHVPLSNVCSIAGYPVGSALWNRTMLFARARKQVGIVLAVAYQDNTTINGTGYRYRIRRVNSGGTELPSTGADEVTITAGSPSMISVPTNMRLVAGDAKLQILWAKPTDERYRAFNVYRSTGGPFRRVNESDISADIIVDLDSAVVSPSPSNGFTDYERWDSAGHVQPRSLPSVAGSFSGPANGTNYQYKVTLKDILGNESSFSSVVSGTPIDKTPPSIPTDIIVTASEEQSSIDIRWPKKTKDVLGHDETVSGYRVYRYSSGENPADPNTAVSAIVAQPIDSTTFLTLADHSNPLRNTCKDSTHWYRILAIDAAGNQSQRSIAVSATLRDTTKPADVEGTTAKGFDDYIRAEWKPNSDCNIEQYLIYRALCDYGDWIPCDTIIKNPFGKPTNNIQYNEKKPGPKSPKDCGGPFVLAGTLTHQDAKSLATSNGGLAYFDDHTVPDGSPVCYAYLIKAQDLSGNISGTFPVPTRPEEIVVCERLRDRTPPPPAIIAGLYSRDSAIRIDFIGQPIQDIAAYHIYRSDSLDGTYKWIGGMTVEPPPLVGHRLSAPYHAPSVVGCDSIPLVSNPYMSAGTFVDKRIERKKIYWYKVLGIDRNANESKLESAVAMSTFTFASNRERPPTVTTINVIEGPCALQLQWTPLFDSTTMLGFVVFRSEDKDGPYLQLQNVITDNTFSDNSVARNKLYWYRVAMLRSDGLLTQLSIPKNALHP